MVTKILAILFHRILKKRNVNDKMYFISSWKYISLKTALNAWKKRKFLETILDGFQIRFKPSLKLSGSWNTRVNIIEVQILKKARFCPVFHFDILLSWPNAFRMNQPIYEATVWSNTVPLLISVVWYSILLQILFSLFKFPPTLSRTKS